MPEEEKVLNPVEAIMEERGRQRSLKIGGDTDEFDKSNTQSDWVAYICAYAGRASGKVRRNEREGQKFRDNMVKVAALALAAIEAYDNGHC